MAPGEMTRRDHVDEMMEGWRAELPEAATVQLEIIKRAGRLKALVEEVTQSVLGEYGLTYAEFDVLATLRRARPGYRLKPSRLASRSSLTTGGTSNILQRLTSAGLVEREPDPADGRSSWVCLTALGAQRAEELALATGEAHKDLLSDVPEDTARALADLLREVLLALGDRPRPSHRN
ncbi:DNA-binding transcriptional regulator, MarR family [Streptosporangium subroseum]|uniref:DNA-binding transcriptional regulator, MarR family n=1 Tax=Streptosporangium subroseum TaxID=106412 RepID=A0A239MUE3_9ACTN|nr:MarR family transcriptional regulator [Streptosporangium subroseum]SNT45873.1 DNA-binding transcriptional regulator, MarR family [Streptosporangium subroseum]